VKTPQAQEGRLRQSDVDLLAGRRKEIEYTVVMGYDGFSVSMLKTCLCDVEIIKDKRGVLGGCHTGKG
jgi:hypothetical protein